MRARSHHSGASARSLPGRCHLSASACDAESPTVEILGGEGTNGRLLGDVGETEEVRERDGVSQAMTTSAFVSYNDGWMVRIPLVHCWTRASSRGTLAYLERAVIHAEGLSPGRAPEAA